MKAVIISRVSTEEQREANNSFPAQTARMEKYCQSKGLEILKKFSFDESAYKNQRDEFDAIFTYIIQQKEKIAVCFDKVDRLSRNIFDKRVSELYEKALRDDIELHFVSDGQVITSQLSAVEKFNFSISLGLAKYYSDAISDNVKRVFEQKLRKGEITGKAPLGYKNITLENDKKDVVIDEYNSKIVQKMFEWYASEAYSFITIRKKLKEDYNMSLSCGTLDQIFSNTFYFGVMKRNGNFYPHKYKSLISQATFDKVQQIRTSRRKVKFKFEGLPYVYRGLLRCADCGYAITPEKHKGIVYYHCTQYKGKHNAQWLREDEITKQLGVFFKSIQVPEAVISEILETLKIVHEGKSNFREEHLSKLFADKDKYQKRIESLYMDRLDGRITELEYDKFYNSFRNKIIEIDADIAIQQQTEDSYYLTVKYLLELANRAYELFMSSEMTEKRQLIKLVLQNLRVDGSLVKFDSLKPFDILANYDHRSSWGG